MTKHHISLKDIAKELNVSISTVSRALKNHPDIGKELTEKIQILAREWNYTPNPLAMGLLKQQTKTIGVIVPDIVTYFYSSIISGIEQIARENGYYIIIKSSYESYEKEKECIENLLMSRVEGLIVCLAQDTEQYDHFDKIIQNEIPLVFFDRVCRTSEVSSVIADSRDAARQIALHFYEAGARKIAFIAGPKHLNITKERIEGYREGLRECGLNESDEILEYINLNPGEARNATNRLLSRIPRPDAIFGINDTIAFEAMKEIKHAGLRIPQDISLIGFTDEYHATVVEPELTSVMHPTFEMGQEAARLLLRQSKEGNKSYPTQVVLKTKLIVRSSSVKF
jgi:LacI family transcriptional regulator